MRLVVLREQVTMGCSMVGDDRVGKKKTVRQSCLSVAGAVIVAAVLTVVAPAAAQDEGAARPRHAGAALVAAYPDFLAGAEGNDLLWKDGTRMTLDDGKGAKTFEVLLDSPDLKDMFYALYPRGTAGLPPAYNSDPGRVRFQPLFDKMYGDCTRGEVERNLVDVVWLQRKGGQRLKVTRVNRVADKLQSVSDELDRLPDQFTRYLKPSAGTYNCRVVAGTRRASAHGHGIAIDIASGPSDYWLWTGPGADGRYPYRNRIPKEIVEVFERHGFIWGGKWYHYDTMHFEYRPEMLGARQ
jgi:hypothetical protein